MLQWLFTTVALFNLTIVSQFLELMSYDTDRQIFLNVQEKSFIRSISNHILQFIILNLENNCM